MPAAERTTLVRQDVLNGKLLCSLFTDHTPLCVSYEKDKAPIMQDLWVSIALDEIIVQPLWMQPIKRSFAGRNPTAWDSRGGRIRVARRATIWVQTAMVTQLCIGCIFPLAYLTERNPIAVNRLTWYGTVSRQPINRNGVGMKVGQQLFYCINKTYIV